MYKLKLILFQRSYLMITKHNVNKQKHFMYHLKQSVHIKTSWILPFFMKLLKNTLGKDRMVISRTLYTKNTSVHSDWISLKPKLPFYNANISDWMTGHCKHGVVKIHMLHSVSNENILSCSFCVYGLSDLGKAKNKRILDCPRKTQWHRNEHNFSNY